jgi:outer membrane scaffolding protein for murein synthesis (MipA/OmpV family)
MTPHPSVRRIRPSLAAVGLLAVFASPPVAAQYQGLVSLPPVGPGDSRLLIGAGLANRTAYLGSDDRVTAALPYIDYAHRNGFFASVTSGIGYSFVNTRTTQVGVRVIPSFGRQENDSDDLRGLGDIDPGVEASAYVTQALSPAWTVGINLRGGDRGAELDVGARRDFVLGPTTRLSAFAFATAANGRSQQTWFGIDDAQSLASGYPVHSPGAGVRNLQLGATVNHFFAGRWIAIGGLGIGRVVGEAADSPIVRERTHVGGFAAIGYRIF